MRCLTLADKLKAQGGDVTFISRHLPTYLRQAIESKKHRVVRIGENSADEPCDELAHAHFLGTSQAQDAAHTQELLQTRPCTWLIIDHYAIDHRWEKAVRPYTQNILVIDDLADRRHDCDLLVDQNLYADMERRYKGRIPEDAVALLGVKYAILRPEFSEARRRAHRRTGEPKRLFIFFGGMDSANYTLPVLRVIQSLQMESEAIEVDVVIGAQHPSGETIQAICREQGYHCHVQTSDMAQLLLHADLAIGAGGSTSWERCCLGVPSLAYVVAQNQEALTQHADHLGLLRAGCADIHDSEALRIELSDFIKADIERERVSKTCLETVDADGANKIVRRMRINGLHLRRATPKDARLLFEWRNHPSVRSVSNNSAIIEWGAHEAWFRKVMQDPDRIVYIAEQDMQAVGVIRFDIDKQVADVSLYLAPGLSGKGLGTQLLLGGEAELLRERPDVERLDATVLEGNEASHRLFRRCAYQFVESKYAKTIQA